MGITIKKSHASLILFFFPSISRENEICHANCNFIIKKVANTNKNHKKVLGRE
jgi:hypothetical protein